MNYEMYCHTGDRRAYILTNRPTSEVLRLEMFYMKKKGLTWMKTVGETRAIKIE